MSSRSPWCELLANVDPARCERAAIRWLQRYIDERLPPLAEVALEIRQMLLDSVGQAEVG